MRSDSRNAHLELFPRRGEKFFYAGPLSFSCALMRIKINPFDHSRIVQQIEQIETMVTRLFRVPRPSIDRRHFLLRRCMHYRAG
jgi:hypothetical protein